MGIFFLILLAVIAFGWLLNIEEVREQRRKSGAEADADGIVQFAGDAVAGAASFARKVNEATEDWHSKASQWHAVQEASNPISHAVNVEKILINAALNSARSEFEIAEQCRKDPLFAEIYAKKKELFAGLISENRTEPLPVVMPPDFSVVPTHPVPEVRDEIERKYQSIKAERDKFLQTVVQDVRGGGGFVAFFWNKLDELGGRHIAAHLRLLVNDKPVSRLPKISGNIFDLIHSAQNTGDYLQASPIGAGVLPTIISKGEDVALQSDPVNSAPLDQTILSREERERKALGEVEKLLSIIQPKIADSEREKPTNISDLLYRLNRVGGLRVAVKQKQIPYLVHFTRVENLPSIMRHGLCPIRTMQEQQIAFRWNDEYRLDGHEDAISLSIGHPNEKLFYRWRRSAPAQSWVVLLIERSILWEVDAKFCPHNAADSRIVREGPMSWRDLTSFEMMFAPQEGAASREEQCLRAFDPTDVQAEVLAFGTIAAEKITGVVFNDVQSLSRWRNELGARQISHVRDGTGLFGLRTMARKNGKIL